EGQLPLPTLEPTDEGGAESAGGTGHSHADSTELAISNVVPDVETDGIQETDPDTAYSGDPGQQQEQVHNDQEQGMVIDGVENRRRRFRDEGLSDAAIEFMAENPRAIKRAKRYSSIQGRFKRWYKDLTGLEDENFTPIVVMNFLSEIYKFRKCAASTILSYKTALIGLFTSEELSPQHVQLLNIFTRTIKESRFKNFVDINYDMAKVIKVIRDWGNTEDLGIADNNRELGSCSGSGGTQRETGRIPNNQAHKDQSAQGHNVMPSENIHGVQSSHGGLNGAKFSGHTIRKFTLLLEASCVMMKRRVCPVLAPKVVNAHIGPLSSLTRFVVAVY
ncbi:hypothetical protein AX774_g4076, partial [Zancudomyces culisetae]